MGESSMLIRKLRAVFTPLKRQENDVSDELRFHLEKEIERNIADGMPPDEARRQALIAFGGVDQTKESLRKRSADGRDSLLACLCRHRL
jgi:hypothetical protein